MIDSWWFHHEKWWFKQHNGRFNQHKWSFNHETWRDIENKWILTNKKYGWHWWFRHETWEFSHEQMHNSWVCMCMYIYIYVRCTDILFGNTTRGVHEGWARKFHIYHRKNKTNIILLKFHRKTDGLSQQGRFGKLMVYPNKREGWRSKSLGFTKGFHLQLIPWSLQSHSLSLVSNVVFEMGMIVMSKQSVDTWGCFQHCKNPRSVLR